MTNALKTAEQYLESLRQLKLRVYFLGKRIENPADFQLTKPSQNAVAMTYTLAQDPEYSDLMTATSHLTSEKVNRFTHIPQNSDDLVKKVKDLLHEGNVNRIIVRDEQGKILLEVPATAGLIGAILAPWLAALGAIAALVTECTISVERRE